MLLLSFTEQVKAIYCFSALRIFTMTAVVWRWSHHALFFSSSSARRSLLPSFLIQIYFGSPANVGSMKTALFLVVAVQPPSDVKWELRGLVSDNSELSERF